MGSFILFRFLQFDLISFWFSVKGNSLNLNCKKFQPTLSLSQHTSVQKNNFQLLLCVIEKGKRPMCVQVLVAALPTMPAGVFPVRNLAPVMQILVNCFPMNDVLLKTPTFVEDCITSQQAFFKFTCLQNY